MRNLFLPFIFLPKWDDGDKNLTATNVSERIYQMLKVFDVSSTNGEGSSVRQLPPSIVQLESRPAAFPLGLGHAVDYISDRAVLIGLVSYHFAKNDFIRSMFS